MSKCLIVQLILQVPLSYDPVEGCQMCGKKNCDLWNFYHSSANLVPRLNEDNEGIP